MPFAPNIPLSTAVKSRVLTSAAAALESALDDLRHIAPDDASAELEGVVAQLESAHRLLTERSLPLNADAALDDARLSRLTRRQARVLDLLGDGRSNREIGEALSISEGTVKLHVAAVLRRLGVGNRTEAALLAKKLRRPNGQA